MPSLQQMMADIRIRLAEPRSQRPSPRTLLKAVLDRTQSLYNQLNNTSKAWAVDEWTLTVTNNTGDYPLGIGASFGKPLLVYTIDASNPAHIEREVDFFEVQNLDFNWDAPNNAAGNLFFSDGSNTTASRIAFFRKDGAVWARIKPIPQLQAQYRILYSIGNWVETAGIADSPVLAEHHHLVETRAAMSVLPSCEWWDKEDENRARRQELMVALKNDEAIYAGDFERYIQSLRSDHMSYRAGADFDG